MKKVFQIKLKSIAKVFTLVVAASLVTFTGCKSYDQDITDINGKLNQAITDIATLKTSVDALKTSVNGMTYIKSITMGTDGKLTITPSTGTAIVYDAKNYVTYDIALVNNVLTVNGVNKGTVAIPALTFGADNKLMSGTTVVADLSGWVRTLTLSADNYLVINGTKSSILIPAATVQSVDVKGITIAGNVLTITKNDNSTSTITLPQTALTLTAVSDTNGGLTLNLNGVDTKVTIKNTYAVAGGFLTVNGVATTVAIPAENKTSVIFTKVDGVIVSATISDGKDTMVVKLNPSTELLSGLLFVPEWIDGGVNAVEVGYMNDITPAKALFNQQNVNFRFNPTAADVSKTTWSFVNNAARLSVSGISNAPGDNNPATPLFAAPVYSSNNDGSGKFTLKVGTWVEPAAGKTHLFALQADGKDFYSNAATHVVSDYVKVVTRQYNAFISKTGTAYTHYITAKPANALFPATGVDYQIVADNSTLLDLDNVVLATANSTLPTALIEKKFEDYGFVDYKWSFSIADAFNAVDGTNQNSFVTLDADNKVKVNTGSSVIDRTPLVKVTLLTKNDKVLAVGYIKLQIVAKLIEPKEVAYSLPAVTFGYASLFNDAVAGVSAGDYKEVILTWPEMNTKVYDAMGLTHNQFQTLYGTATPTVTYSFTPGAGSIAPAVATTATTLAAFPLIASQHNPDVDTYAMKIQVNPMAKFGTYVVNYKYATADPKDPRVTITFTYTITKPVLDKAIIPAYQFTADAAKYPTVTTDAAHTVFTQGIKTAGPPASYAMELNLGEGFGFGSAALQAAFGVAAGKIDPATQEFIVTDSYAIAGPPAVASYVFSQALPSQTSIPALLGTSNATGVKMGMNPANPLNVDYRAYLVNFKTTYPNSEVDDFKYTVIFKNPLTIELESTADFDLLDIVTGAKDQIDLSKNYVVKMLGEVIFNKTGITAKAAEYGITAPTMTYTVPNITPAFAYAYSFATPIATWENAGTKLTSKQKVSDAKFVFGTTFASISRTDVVNVNPDLSLGAKRK